MQLVLLQLLLLAYDRVLTQLELSWQLEPF